MNQNNIKSNLSDFVIRSSSLIFFAILFGVSLQFGIEKILEPNIKYSVVLNFLTFLITTIRFFHGNYIYHEKPRIKEPVRFMLDFYFNIAIIIALCIAGRLIDNGARFLLALLGLSIIDIVGIVLSLCISKPGERDILWVWGKLNLASAIFLILLIILNYSAVGAVSIVILIFYCLMAVLDYWFGRNYYFKIKT